MKKLTLLLLLLSSVGYSQWPPERSNPEYYPSLRIRDSINFDFLNSSDTTFLVRIPGTLNLQSLTISQVRGIISGGSEYTDAEAIAAVRGAVDTSGTQDLADVIANGNLAGGQINMQNNRIRSLGTPSASSDAATKGYVDGQIPSPQTLSFNTSTDVLSISDGNGVDLSSLSGGGGGSGGLNDTIVISGGRDTVTNNHEEVLFISENNTGEDTLYLQNSLNLDSLSNFYVENHRDGLLVIDGGLNSLNEQINTALNVPARGAVFIKCLGIIDGVRRFSAIGNYTQE